MPRLSLESACRLAVALILATTTFVAKSPFADHQAPPIAHAQGRDFPRHPRRQPGAIVAHEWGVWMLDRGQVTHLAALAAECPPFVFQAGSVRPPPIPIPPVRPPHPHPPFDPHDHPAARKPVLFLYADQPTAVEVRVQFTEGTPWLFYPQAQETRLPSATGLDDGLIWRGRLEPGRLQGYRAVSRSHFWNDLRAAGATPFVASDGSVESFLFYDGPVRFMQPFLIASAPGGAHVTQESSERMLWLAGQGRFVESEVDRHGSQVRAQGPMAQMRVRLAVELLRRGLTPQEGNALLETWRDELFGSSESRAIYFVPRDLYDAMLPMTITPTPSQLVRVGLVIERLDRTGAIPGPMPMPMPMLEQAPPMPRR